MNEKLDLRSVPCPQNISKILIKLEMMDSGEILEVLLDEGEPLENVCQAILEEGHLLIKKEKQEGNTCLLWIKKI